MSTLPTDPNTLAELAPISLKDGAQLDPRQSLACRIAATGEFSQSQIAEQCGYSSQAVVSNFLRSDRGKEGTEIALRELLIVAGKLGLKQALWTVQRAKSERLRWEAAVDLMNRAGLAEQADAKRAAGSGGVSISINLPDVSQPRDVTIEGTSSDVTHEVSGENSPCDWEGEGPGSKLNGVVPSDPTHPDKMQPEKPLLHLRNSIERDDE